MTDHRGQDEAHQVVHFSDSPKRKSSPWHAARINMTAPASQQVQVAVCRLFANHNYETGRQGRERYQTVLKRRHVMYSVNNLNFAE